MLPITATSVFDVPREYGPLVTNTKDEDEAVEDVEGSESVNKSHSRHLQSPKTYHEAESHPFGA